MRPNARTTTLSKMREIAGIDQSELASLVGRSVHTIRNIEQTKTPLTRGLARKISAVTGIDYLWLMEGNPEANPVADSDSGDRIFTRETYERRRAIYIEDAPAPFQVEDAFLDVLLMHWISLVKVVSRNALKIPGGRQVLANELYEFVSRLEDRFGMYFSNIGDDLLNAAFKASTENFAATVKSNPDFGSFESVKSRIDAVEYLKKSRSASAWRKEANVGTLERIVQESITAGTNKKLVKHVVDGPNPDKQRSR